MPCFSCFNPDLAQPGIEAPGSLPLQPGVADTVQRMRQGQGQDPAAAAVRHERQLRQQAAMQAHRNNLRARIIELDTADLRADNQAARARMDMVQSGAALPPLPGQVRNSIDLAISNVPFGGFKVPGARDCPRLLIQDYFFARALDRARQGDLLLLVTSDGTLDKGRFTAVDHHPAGTAGAAAARFINCVTTRSSSCASATGPVTLSVSTICR